MVKVSLLVEYGDRENSRLEANVTVGATVLNLMNATHFITFAGGGDFGAYITSIDGLAENQTDYDYWILYVNGNMSMVGASNFIIDQPCDIVYKYEKVF